MRRILSSNGIKMTERFLKINILIILSRPGYEILDNET